MNYTIAHLAEAHSDFAVEYCKDGNEYYIYISTVNENGRVGYSRRFKNTDKAVKIFLLLSEAVCRSLYDFSGRKAILDGEIDHI